MSLYVPYHHQIYCPPEGIFGMPSLLKKQKHECCGFCNKTSEFLKLCTQCRVVKYCDKQCQTSDWKKHKKECLYIIRYLRNQNV